MAEHRIGLHKGFTGRYNLTKLIYFEEFTDPNAATAREKQFKSGLRQQKLDAVASLNPNWEELLPA